MCSFPIESHQIRVRVSYDPCQFAHTLTEKYKHILVQLVLQAFIKSKNGVNQLRGQ